ncbi:MAG: type II toxin-antitoxin system VapC family toxin [Candidatus Promineifilaceae bacterium]|nr:type II toxin-antitoxin system VapC family toxin [Candidatus Promineifilaceae bacterium]
MNVVDSSGWLEYFSESTNADFFAPAIQKTESLIVPTICVYEVFKRLFIQRGEEKALTAVGIMSLGHIAELTREIAVNAASLSAELKLAMADSVILATARTHHATLWTQDADLAKIDRVRYIRKK